MIDLELERFTTTCAIYAYAGNQEELASAYPGAVVRQASPSLFSVRVAGYTLDDEERALQVLAEEKARIA